MHFSCITYLLTSELFLSLFLTPLSACPPDLLSYAGLVLCIVLTHASLSFSPTLRLKATIEPLTVSSDGYFRLYPSPKIHLVVVSIGNSSSTPSQRARSAWIILLLLSRITSMGVAPTAIASASVSCLSPSSLLSVKKNCSHMKLLALHCSPQLVF